MNDAALTDHTSGGFKSGRGKSTMQRTESSLDCRAMNAANTVPKSESRRISRALLGAEPFRLFFPLGTLAGLIGVALWPLHFTGMIESYPGQNHGHIMANGLFGSFIFGFLGTAMPRMLSLPRFSFW